MSVCAPAWESQATVAMFGNKEEKAAQAAAAQAKADRLLALPVADLAAEIMAERACRRWSTPS
jgi:hypothetical protein